MSTFTHKQGDHLEWVMDTQENDAIADITGWNIKSQIRDSANNVVADLTVTITDAAGGVFSVSATHLETASWEVGTHSCDIQFTDADGIVFSTSTFSVVIEKDVTQ